MSTTEGRSADHQSFTIERSYRASPADVFAAWSDAAAKRRWFVEGDGFTTDEYRLDFRVGGEEIWRGNEPGGAAITADTVYHDIVPEERIVASYRMTVNGQPISVSLATTELIPHDGGTRLTYTEQAVFLDGRDSAESRRGGCKWLLERLAEELGETAEAA